MFSTGQSSLYLAPKKNTIISNTAEGSETWWKSAILLLLDQKYVLSYKNVTFHLTRLQNVHTEEVVGQNYAVFSKLIRFCPISNVEMLKPVLKS